MAQDGAYLIFDVTSKGSLFIVWSRENIPGALCFFKPRKPVAEFKYKQNGGKSELIRNCQSDENMYFRGWCTYVKAAKQVDGDITVLPNEGPIPVKVVLLEAPTTVKLLKTNESSSISKAIAAACIHRDNSGFDLKTLTLPVFISKVNSSRGSSLSF